MLKDVFFLFFMLFMVLHAIGAGIVAVMTSSVFIAVITTILTPLFVFTKFIRFIAVKNFAPIKGIGSDEPGSVEKGSSLWSHGLAVGINPNANMVSSKGENKIIKIIKEEDRRIS